MNSAYLIEERTTTDGWANNYLIEDKNGREPENYAYNDGSTMLISRRLVKTTIIMVVLISIIMPILIVSSIKGKYYKKELDAANKAARENVVPDVSVTNNIFSKGSDEENVNGKKNVDTEKTEPERASNQKDDTDNIAAEDEYVPKKIGSVYLRELKPMVDHGTWNIGEAWWSPQYLNTGEEICYAIASSRSQSQDELTFYIGNQSYSHLTAQYAWWNKYNSEASLKGAAEACKIYCDNELVWASPEMDVYSMPEDIDIEIPSGCKQLTILFAGAANGILMDPKLTY